MDVNTECKAFVLAEIVALLDGASTDGEVKTCAEPVGYAVVLRRSGVEVAADVCAKHEQMVAHLDMGHVRSIRKRIRST